LGSKEKLHKFAKVLLRKKKDFLTIKECQQIEQKDSLNPWFNGISQLKPPPWLLFLPINLNLHLLKEVVVAQTRS
jgi:hypothetical protein